MRITGGELRGRIVDCPKGDLEIRPAMDRMRESVFAVLGDLNGRSFLDLFSGSGVLALEAASRGASPVVCVEKDRGKFPLLLRNVAIAPERIECKCLASELFIKRTKSKFDLIFCDPPFPYRFRLSLLESISDHGVCSPGGLVLIHHPGEDGLPDAAGSLVATDRRVFGRSIVAFYRMSPLTGVG
ncbi:MAG: RsmD family RNA methyltransferase [Spirochaetes bacterium]|nr:RsmD family RNA methyltransferase [Spirochaetota bacterium]